MQATFDLSVKPELAHVNEDTEGMTWVLKLFTSETVALIKDTDKEDREKALKASWETAEPGRAEKAAKSRQRFLLQGRLAQGETLTAEEMEVVREKRERVKASDKEEAAAAASKGKKAPPPKKDDKKKDAKGGDKGAPTGGSAEIEEDNTPKIILPEPQDHINSNIVGFLQHYKAPRLI